MRTVCLPVSATRGTSLREVSRYLVERRAKMQKYLHEKNFDNAPENSRWLLLSMISSTMKSVNRCFKIVQGCDTLLCKQNQHFEALCHELKGVTHMMVVSSERDVLAFIVQGDVTQHSNGLCLACSGLETFIDELGSYACSLSDGATKEDDLTHYLCMVFLYN